MRQRWPQRIVSWSRLLAVRWRDPLVGRDVLIGALFGASIIAINYLSASIPGWLGFASDLPRSINFDTLLGGRHLLGMLFSLQVEGLVSSFGAMILLLLLYLVVKREWLAVTGVWLLLTVMRMLGDQVTSISQGLHDRAWDGAVYFCADALRAPGRAGVAYLELVVVLSAHCRFFDVVRR